MKKQLFSLSLMAAVAVPCLNAASFLIDGQEYEYDLLVQKEVGPGITYTRIRVPDFPLNINYMKVDLANPYNRIETFQGQDLLGKTEKIVDVAARMREDGKKPVGGQNANFWVVASQPKYETFCMGATYNGNVQNGYIITETNGAADQWDGGPARTGVVAIDADKKLWIESMSCKGTVRAEKWGGQVPEFTQVNKFCNAGNEMVMYNKFYGADKAFQTVVVENGEWKALEGQNAEVYFKLDEGQEWGVAHDFTATVGAVKTNTSGGKLGDYDFALSATGSFKALLEQLAPGDKVTVNYGWTSYDTNETPEIENLVGGNAIVLKNGELTSRNTDESYNTQVYSRSAYGMSKDGKTLYMLVIDKSTDPVYGMSAGCNTSVMAQIMKALGAWNVCNVDAGGSAQLMVQDAIVNRTTEGTPRAVANGWMVYSVAPESSEIARIEFLDPELNIPVYSSYTPVILGYNEYGELIDENVQGVELSCDASVGTASGGTFNAGGNVVSGTLTAKLGGIVVEKAVNVVEAEVALRIPKLLTDDRDYRIEVVSKSGLNEFLCDPSRMVWTVGDESVLMIEDGILKGLKNGSTVIRGEIGNFETEGTVTVEIPEKNILPVLRIFPADMEAKQLGGTGLVVSEMGNGMKLNYTGNDVSRGAYIEVSPAVQVYSLPTAFCVRINPGEAEVTKVSMSAVNGLGETISSFVFTEDALPKNTFTTLELPLSGWCDPNDLAVYPITINSLRLGMGKSENGKAFEIQIPGFDALYGGVSGIDAVQAERKGAVHVYPNPVTGGVVNVELPEDAENAEVEVFNSSGMTVVSNRIEVDGTCAAFSIGNVASGIYYLRVTTADGVFVQPIIVK